MKTRINFGRALSIISRHDVTTIVKQLQDNVDALDAARQAQNSLAQRKTIQAARLDSEAAAHRAEAQRAHRVAQKIKSLLA
jgi:hypothetical protein